MKGGTSTGCEAPASTDGLNFAQGGNMGKQTKQNGGKDFEDFPLISDSDSEV